nr:site-specific integrase [Mobiluncus mulieris]
MFLRQIPGETPVGAITRQQIESWIAWQRQQVTQRRKLYSAKTIANAHGILSSVLQYQVELGRIPYNPARGVKIPRDTATRQIVFLTSAQVDAIAGECGKYEVFVRFLYVTGLRFGEATALTAEDIDLGGGVVHVRRAWKKENSWKKYLGSPKSERGIRAVSIPQSLCGMLEPLVEAASPWVFPSPRIPSKPLNASHFRERIWRPAVEAAGVKPAPRVHDLRHSCASRLMQEDIPLPVIQARLGHESIKTTVDTYGHVTAEQAREAANVFE